MHARYLRAPLLNKRGIDQALQLGMSFAQFDFKPTILSSHLPRAIFTAGLIAATLDIGAVYIVPFVRERNNAPENVTAFVQSTFHIGNANASNMTTIDRSKMYAWVISKLIFRITQKQVRFNFTQQLLTESERDPTLPHDVSKWDDLLENYAQTFSKSVILVSHGGVMREYQKSKNVEFRETANCAWFDTMRPGIVHTMQMSTNIQSLVPNFHESKNDKWYHILVNCGYTYHNHIWLPAMYGEDHSQFRSQSGKPEEYFRKKRTKVCASILKHDDVWQLRHFPMNDDEPNVATWYLSEWTTVVFASEEILAQLDPRTLTLAEGSTDDF